jgi:hypothetical protein
MIDFSKITQEDISEMKLIVSKAAEKSELEKYYLFTTSIIEKAHLFIFCYRLMVNLNNLAEGTSLKKAIEDELNSNKEIYLKLNQLLTSNEEISYNTSQRTKKINNMVSSREVEDMIDLFSVLTEKTNIIQISKLKGILLEGKSGEAYNKAFKKVE